MFFMLWLLWLAIGLFICLLLLFGYIKDSICIYSKFKNKIDADMNGFLLCKHYFFAYFHIIYSFIWMNFIVGLMVYYCLLWFSLLFLNCIINKINKLDLNLFVFLNQRVSGFWRKILFVVFVFCMFFFHFL